MRSGVKRNWSAARIRLSVLCAMVPFVVWGCKSISPEEMVPKSAAQAGLSVGKSVRVMAVTGDRESSFGGPSFITNEQFKKALSITLQQSHLFNEVGGDLGDLDLLATIRSQDQRVSRGLQYTATMTVTYRFLDRAGKVVWTGSYDSEYSSVAFSGAARTVNAREGCARENLAALVQGIKDEWLKK
jgi:hypothetical protein